MFLYPIYESPRHKRLILIFAGWGSYPNLYKNLHAEGWDIMLLFDYYDLNHILTCNGEMVKLNNLLNHYESIYILAWSLGVAAAGYTFANPDLESIRHKIAGAFAINGTLNPASDDFGIPVDIYRGTSENLSPKSLLKFFKRISNPTDAEKMPVFKYEGEYDIDIEKLRSELEGIADINVISLLPWRRVYISNFDRIMPADGQKRAWKSYPGHPQTIELDCGHYVSFQKVIDEITPNHTRIANCFQKALNTYDDSAEAQRRIVDNLLSMIPEDLKERPLNVLEIGAGSGTLSLKLASHIRISKITFVDLYPLSKFNIVENEEYVVADAEDWMDSCPNRSYDMIISANTMQWFADPGRFFRNASRVLAPGGALLCSTFLPGNLKELDALRPAPLLYIGRVELEKMLQHSFAHITTKEEDIKVSFSSYRHLLMHLKHTGVAGSTTLAKSPLHHAGKDATPETRTLTFRPVYILAR